MQHGNINNIRKKLNVLKGKQQVAHTMANNIDVMKNILRQYSHDLLQSISTYV